MDSVTNLRPTIGSFTICVKHTSQDKATEDPIQLRFSGGEVLLYNKEVTPLLEGNILLKTSQKLPRMYTIPTNTNITKQSFLGQPNACIQANLTNPTPIQIFHSTFKLIPSSKHTSIDQFTLSSSQYLKDLLRQLSLITSTMKLSLTSNVFLLCLSFLLTLFQLNCQETSTTSLNELFQSLQDRADVQHIIQQLHKLDSIDILNEYGRAPLVTAVRAGHYPNVELLINAGANANIQERDGSTPLSVAFQNDFNEIAKLILKYGGSIDAQYDERGKPVRELARSEFQQNLIKQFDERGYEAFEDAPGDWLRGYDANSEHHYYYYNIKSEQSSWRVPPSCSWTTKAGPHEHFFYINVLTQQVKHTMPKALSWRLINQKDEQGQEKQFWFNFATNFSMMNEPAELPIEMLEEAKKHPNYYWYNTQTKQVSWVDPATLTWRAVKHPEVDQIYYYHPETLETSWELPEELAWEKVQAKEEQGQEEVQEEGDEDDEARQEARIFYHNRLTGKSQWEEPEHLAWILHDEL